MKTLLLISCMASAALGQSLPTEPMTLGWDPVPTATSYEVWREGTELMAVVATNEATFPLPVGDYSTLVVVARNAGGGSPGSKPFKVQPLRNRYTFDLVTWHLGPWFFAPDAPCLFSDLQHLRVPNP